jgi:hypothetical protein
MLMDAPSIWNSYMLTFTEEDEFPLFPLLRTSGSRWDFKHISDRAISSEVAGFQQ